MEELTGEIMKAQGGVFVSICRKPASHQSWSWQNQNFGKIQQEFGKRALAVEHLLSNYL